MWKNRPLMLPPDSYDDQSENNKRIIRRDIWPSIVITGFHEITYVNFRSTMTNPKLDLAIKNKGIREYAKLFWVDQQGIDKDPFETLTAMNDYLESNRENMRI